MSNKVSPYWIEVGHGFIGELGGDRMGGEGACEVDQGEGRRDIPPVQQMIQLEETKKKKANQ